MLLQELFRGDNIIPWKWNYDDVNSGIANFKIGELTYTINFMEKTFGDIMKFQSRETIQKYGNLLDVDAPIIAIYFYSRKEGTSMRFAPTGEGNAFLVYNTIVDTVKNYVTNVKPRALYFSAITESQGNIYYRLMKKIGVGWNLVKMSPKEFILYR